MIQIAKRQMCRGEGVDPTSLLFGLVEPEELGPGDSVGVNKDSYLILEKLPTEYDSRVKAMGVNEPFYAESLIPSSKGRARFKSCFFLVRYVY